MGFPYPVKNAGSAVEARRDGRHGPLRGFMAP